MNTKLQNSFCVGFFLTSTISNTLVSNWTLINWQFKCNTALIVKWYWYVSKCKKNDTKMSWNKWLMITQELINETLSSISPLISTWRFLNRTNVICKLKCRTYGTGNVFYTLSKTRIHTQFIEWRCFYGSGFKWLDLIFGRLIWPSSWWKYNRKTTKLLTFTLILVCKVIHNETCAIFFHIPNLFVVWEIW